MKSLVVFYSRTGTTKKVANEISKLLKADTEEIMAAKDRKGIIGYLLSGGEATLKKPAKIMKLSKNPASYDLVVIGTPIWAWNISSPVRAYLEQAKGNIKKAAFFCTMGSSGHEAAFKEMEITLRKRPAVTLGLKTQEVTEGKYAEKVKRFVREI